MRSILVTGGAGFIGSNLVLYLLEAYPEQRIINLDKLTYAGNLDNLQHISGHPRHIFVQGDIGNQELVQYLFKTFDISSVYHLAAESHVDRSIDGPEAFIKTNVQGTCTLLESARNYWSRLSAAGRDRFRFLHVSTDEVYGSLGREGLFREDTPYAPSSPYSASKASADHLVRAWHQTFGLPVVLTNCSNNYGPYQFPEKLIPLMIINGLQGRELPVYGQGQNIRDWLFVKDHARALELVARKGRPGQTYNIGGQAEKSNIEIVELVCELLDERSPLSFPRRQLIRFVPDRPGHDLRYAMDIGKISSELGWQQQESLASGLEKTVQWYLNNKWWWQAIQARGYQGQRLGLAGVDAGY